MLSLNHVTAKWNHSRRDGGLSDVMLGGVGLDDLFDKLPDEVIPLGQGDDRLAAKAAGELA